MSYTFGSQPATQHPTQQSYQDAEGQQHDRVQLSKQDNSTMASSSTPDITISQRMISATWGSVLTSLLGMDCASMCPTILTCGSHTSRCCPCTITIPNRSRSSYHQPFQIPCLRCQFQAPSPKPGRDCVLSRSLLGRKQWSILPGRQWTCHTCRSHPCRLRRGRDTKKDLHLDV